MHKSVLTIPLLSFWAVIALADPPPQTAAPAPNAAKLQKVRELMDTFRIAETITQERTVCIQEAMTGPFSPEKWAAEKGNYRGFKPGSAEWPRVLAAYETSTKHACSYLTPERVMPAYIQFYDERLTEADIDSYLAFQKTPAAQHMNAARADAVVYLSQLQVEISEPILKAANDQLAANLEAICDDMPWYRRLFCHQN